MDQHAQLAQFTTIVADTGEVSKIEALKPEDATTNPSLILKAVEKTEYQGLVEKAIQEADEIKEIHADRLTAVMDLLAVTFGCEILKVVKGVVSTEIDARLSFDTAATVDRARAIIELYKRKGISKDRVLIKLASTWEGIRAAEILEKEGIHCNMTLLFSLCQAVEAAHVKATLISPFVGRITDWHKKASGRTSYEVDEDPGVLSVRSIFDYYKTFGHKTIVMGASFRSKAQVLALAGCDKLTISPALLEEMSNSTDNVERVLGGDSGIGSSPNADLKELNYTEPSFRWALNEDQCATEKLAEGIRRFAADTVKLEKLVSAKLSC